MYTTSTMPDNVQLAILNNAKAAVISYVTESYPKFFCREEIEDIISTTCYKACRSIGCYNESVAKLSTWIRTIARNCVKDEVNYKVRHLPISQPMYEMDNDGEEYSLADNCTCTDVAYDADRNIIMQEFQEAVDRGTSSLSEKNLSFFEMMADEKEPTEMSKETGCTATAAATRSSNIRKAIKPAFREIAREFGISCKKLES